MKKKAWKGVSVLLVFCMLLSLLPPMIVVAESESEMEEFPQQEETQQTILSSQAGEEEGEIDEGKLEDGSRGATMPGDSSQGAVPEGEEEAPDNSVGTSFGSDANLGAVFDEIDEDEIVYLEGDSAVHEDSESEEEDNPTFQGEDIATLQAGVSLHASSTSVVVPQDGAISVPITYADYFGRCYMKAYSSTQKLFSLSWGTWSGKTIPLSIYGLKAGTGKITIYLMNANNDQKVAKLTLNVSVTSLYVAVSQLTLKIGDSQTVGVNYNGYAGSAYPQYTTTNSKAFSCEWLNGNFRFLKITGTREGTGSVNLYYKSSSGETLAKTSISVTVTKQIPKITLSTSSVRLTSDGKQTVYATYSGCSEAVYFQYGSTGGSSYSCEWGSWQGNTIPLELRGNTVGRGKVVVYLKRDADGKTLTQAEINTVTVEDAEPQLTLSDTDISLNSGTGKTIQAEVTGVTGRYYLTYNITNSAICSLAWGSWVGNKIPLRITGKKTGVVTVDIRMYRSSGELLKSKPLTVTVNSTTPESTVEFIASSPSVSVRKNTTEVVKLTYKNYDRPVSISGSIQGSAYFSYKWGEWSGKTATLSINGLTKGSGRIELYLKDKETKQDLSRLTIDVTVTPNTDGMTIEDVGYNFRNYGKDMIPRELCQFIFGNTERAEQVYMRNVGLYGCCFGFASSAALIFHRAENMEINQFAGGLSRVSQLSKTTNNLALRLTGTELIEAMQVSQLALNRSWGEAAVAQTIKSEISAGRCVLLSLRGSTGGHAVLAYDYEETASGMTVKIADSNHPLAPQELILTKSGNAYNGWSYKALNWGNGQANAKIGCLTFADLNRLWNNRGPAASLMDSEDPIDATPTYPVDLDPKQNLLITSEDDFEMWYFDWSLDKPDDQLMLRYQNGEITYQNPNYNIEECPIMSMGEVGKTHFVYLPSDEYYTVKDLSGGDGINMTMVNINLSVSVNTDSNQFELVVSDEDKLAKAVLKETEKDDAYSISIGCVADGERTEYIGAGTADETGDIGLGLNDGDLETPDGNSVGLVSIIREEDGYEVRTISTEGGTIYPDGVRQYAEGDKCNYRFIPNDGYVLSSVRVNGDAVNPENGVWSMEFHENSMKTYTIVAEFKRDIAACQAELSSYECKLTNEDSARPQVTVKTSEGDALKEGVDFKVEYSNNQSTGTASAFIFAEDNSEYSGFLEKNYQVIGDWISSAAYSSAGNNASVQFETSQDGYIAMVLYNAAEQQTVVKCEKITSNRKDVTFTFDSLPPENCFYYRVFLTDALFYPVYVYDSRTSPVES